MKTDDRVLLKNGLIVDGSGSKGFTGDLLIQGDKIEEVSSEPVQVDCRTTDCTGKVISPGIIDMHSHMDWILPIPGRADLKSPFTAQGCTTFIAGNCGFSPTGIAEESPYREMISLGGGFPYDITWNTLEGFSA
ncbi:MAG: hypothetical protein GY866_38480, partial [Proteobacteria bacterium]|nr:hypothetical protein [Pseudomonadota bacterium]